MIKKEIAHYKILEKLGEGGMGVVYKAEDTKLKRTVALKFLPPELTRDPEAKARFIHEAQAASTLQHNNICTIHEIAKTEDGQMYICMDFYEGKTLRNKINQGPLSIKQAIDLAIQISKGLTAAHKKEVIHRDIKPANIIVTHANEVKLVDFGLAKLTSQTKLTVEGMTLGTVAYMSPEQSQGKTVDLRTDIWSLGVVLYEMITGKSPFQSEYNQATMYSILNEEPEPPTGLRTGVPMALERVIFKALAKNPDERYQHLDDLVVDLEGILKETDPSSRVQTQMRTTFPVKRQILRKIILPLTVILSLIIIYLILKPIIERDKRVIDPKPIVVISFKNQTGDSQYDYLQEAIPNLLITNLEQSRYLSVITWERLYDLLKQTGKPDVKIIDQEIGFELCQLEGIEAIVLGSFVKAGDIFATDVKVLDVQSKKLLTSANTKGNGVSSILQDQIDELSKEISKGVNISESSIAQTQIRISDVTTKSMEAYHYYLKGKDAYEKIKLDEARIFLNKAIKLDTTFALAYLELAKIAARYLEEGLRDQFLEKAKIYSSRATEKDRMYIEALYARFIEKNPTKRLNILMQLAEKYPKEKQVFYNLGIIYRIRGQLELAIKSHNRALDLDPNFAAVFNDLSYIYGELGDFRKAEECLIRYTELLPGDANPLDSFGAFYMRTGRIVLAIQKYKEAIKIDPQFGSELGIIFAYAIQEDYFSALEWLDRYMSNSTSLGRQGTGHFWKAVFSHLTGQNQNALNEFEQAGKIAELARSRMGTAYNELLKAWIYLDLNNYIQAKRSINFYYDIQAKNNPQNLADHKADFAFWSGTYYSNKYKTDSIGLQFKEIKRLYPELSSDGKKRYTHYHKYLYTQILVNVDSLAKAIDINSDTKSILTSFIFDENFLYYNFPFSRDILPKALSTNGQIEDAIKQYELLIELDPSKREFRLISPKYHYRLAKLYQKHGSVQKAKEQYIRFLDIWKYADDDLPEKIDAQKRLAVLEKE